MFPDGPLTETTADKQDRKHDFGILSMIILDLQPFNVVSRCTVHFSVNCTD